MRKVRRLRPLMFLSTLGLALGACGGVGERTADVTAAATAFEHLLSTDDPAALCASLAPQTRGELEDSEKQPCEKAITSQDLPAGGRTEKTDVYGRQARVVLATDTLFLSRFPDGWKIVAAGCTPRPGMPFQCDLQGG
ncbi:hypothetical protein ABZ896_49315 [Streptomyces sp. NPDC047072]|uniref:hypothetical protein n=1 Tax=Streptomyces sp. NPDC047072 TaxID=3154809 RepID=UPI0033F4D873